MSDPTPSDDSAEELVAEPVDDGEAGALAALAAIESGNYERAHQPNPIIEE